MEKTTKRRLEELVAVGTGLNAAVDALVEDIRALERRLSDLRLAFDGKGAIPLDEEDDDVAADDGEPEAPVVERRLVYGQHEGVWRILVRCFEEDVDTGALRA